MEVNVIISIMRRSYPTLLKLASGNNETVVPVLQKLDMDPEVAIKSNCFSLVDEKDGKRLVINDEAFDQFRKDAGGVDVPESSTTYCPAIVSIKAFPEATTPRPYRNVIDGVLDWYLEELTQIASPNQVTPAMVY